MGEDEGSLNRDSVKYPPAPDEPFAQNLLSIVLNNIFCVDSLDDLSIFSILSVDKIAISFIFVRKSFDKLLISLALSTPCR